MSQCHKKSPGNATLVSGSAAVDDTKKPRRAWGPEDLQCYLTQKSWVIYCVSERNFSSSSTFVITPHLAGERLPSLNTDSSSGQWNKTKTAHRQLFRKLVITRRKLTAQPAIPADSAILNFASCRRIPSYSAKLVLIKQPVAKQGVPTKTEQPLKSR